MKKILVILILALSVTTVNAKNIEFSEEEYLKYFEKRNYEITNTTCIEDPNYDLSSCKMIIAFNKNLKREVDAFIFDSEEEAFKYFQYVYDDNVEALKDVVKHNFDKTEDSNYSYFRAELSEMFYFYVVNIDNYVIKTNIEKNSHEFMDKIFDDLDMIENPNKKNNNISSKYLIISILCIILVIFNALAIRSFIRNKKRRNKEL